MEGKVTRVVGATRGKSDCLILGPVCVRAYWCGAHSLIFGGVTDVEAPAVVNAVTEGYLSCVGI